MSAKVREDLVLSHAVVTAEVEAPFDHVDIAQWLKTLPTHEYQRCAPPDHKAAGYTVDDDGTPMSINVEMIGAAWSCSSIASKSPSPSTARWCHCRKA